MMDQPVGYINTTNVPQYTYVMPIMNQQQIRNPDTVLRALEYPSGSNPRRFSEYEIAYLLNIRWKDGVPVLSLTSPELFYEITSICVQSEDFKKACDLINMITVRFDSVTASEIGVAIILDFFPFLKEHHEYTADIDRSKNAIDLIQGREQCKRCGSMKTSSIEIQLRSSDESTSNRHYCRACGHRWMD